MMDQKGKHSEPKQSPVAINIEIRKKQLQSLNQYINSSKNKVISILDSLGWKAKEVLKSKDKVACPINPNHTVPTEKIDQHVHKCSLKTAGYEPDEQFLSEPSSNTSSISLDNAKKVEVLTAARSATPKFVAAWNGIEPSPKTSDRLQSTFSPDERLALYEYCVKNTEPPPVPPELFINLSPDEKDQNLTREEMLERERNARRRRVKYKSVHTGRNKSYTEVMSEVIDNQMKLYKEHLEEHHKQKKREPHKDESSQNHHKSHLKDEREPAQDYDRIARIERMEKDRHNNERNGRNGKYSRRSYDRSRSRDNTYNKRRRR